MITVRDNFLDEDSFQDLLYAYEECRMYSAYEFGKRDGAYHATHSIISPQAYYAVQDWIDCYRSDDIKNLFGDVTDKIHEVLGIEVQLMTFFRHPVEKFKRLHTYGDEIKQHIDRNFERSGVLYMIGDKGQGTVIKDEYVEWKQNRAVAFDAHTLHNPCFGGKDRVALTFFGKKT